jgi:hypothetical protein
VGAAGTAGSGRGEVGAGGVGQGDAMATVGIGSSIGAGSERT